MITTIPAQARCRFLMGAFMLLSKLLLFWRYYPDLTALRWNHGTPDVPSAEASGEARGTSVMCGPHRATIYPVVAINLVGFTNDSPPLPSIPASDSISAIHSIPATPSIPAFPSILALPLFPHTNRLRCYFQKPQP